MVSIDLKNLDEFAEKCRNIELEIHKLYREKNELEHKLKLYESTILSNISQEINKKTGKPIFTSDTTRRAELERRLSEDTIYQRLNENLKEINDNIVIKKIDLNYYTNLLKNNRVFLRYLSGLKEDNEVIRTPIKKIVKS